MKSLLSLANFVEALGVYRDPRRLGDISSETLRSFVDALIVNPPDQWKQDGLDIGFLKRMSDTWTDGWGTTHKNITRALSEVPQSVRQNAFVDIYQSKVYIQSSKQSVKHLATEGFTRTHTLLSALLPPDHKVPSPTSVGPTSSSDVPVTLHTAQPSARFGLILVGDP